MQCVASPKYARDGRYSSLETAKKRRECMRRGETAWGAIAVSVKVDYAMNSG